MKTYIKSGIFLILTLAGLALSMPAMAAPLTPDNLAIGTLPAGKSITITFDVVVNRNLPPDRTAISQQGTVSGSNFTAVLTDDPDDGASDEDPTVTAVANLAPVAGFGNALDLDGADDYLEIAGGDTLGNAYTYEAWVNFRTVRPSTLLLRAPGTPPTAFATALYLDASGHFVHAAADGSHSVTGTTAVVAGRWYHVAATLASGTMRLYVNGIEEGTAVAGVGPLGAGDRYLLGHGLAGAGDNYLDGQLDEIRFWDTALDTAHLAAWMYRGIDPSHLYYGDLLAWYRLDEVDGTTVLDSAGTLPGELVNLVDTTRPASTVGDLQTDEDTPVIGKFAFSDRDGSSTDAERVGFSNNLSFIVTDQTLGTVSLPPAGGDAFANSFTFTPTTDVGGEGTITYKVYDGSDYSGEHTLKITVTPVYDVTFDLNGGTQTGGDLQQRIVHGKAATAPTFNPPVGKTFTGWIPADFANVTADLTIEAQYIDSVYEVTFDSRGGSAVASVSAVHGSKLTAPAPPSRSGYVFVGWYRDAGLLTPWDFASDTVLGDLTLHARWGVVPAFTSANGTTFTYGGAGTFAVTASGDPAPTFATLSTLPAGVTLASNGTLSGTPTVTGTFPLTITASNLVGSAEQSFTLTVGKANASVTLDAFDHTYNGLPKAASATTVPAGLTVTFTYDGSPAAPTEAGGYAVVATVSDTNYQGSANGTLTIAKAAQTIALAATAEATYGDSDFGLGATAASGLPLTYESDNPAVATVDANGLVHIVGAGDAALTARQAGNNNYLPASAGQQLTVHKALLTVTAENASRAFGAANPAFSFVVTGFVNGEDSAVLSGAPELTTAADSSSPVGAYPISIAQGDLTAANYAFTFVDGILAVGLTSQTIVFHPLPAKTYGDPTFALVATGGGSGNPVTFSSSDPAVATVSGSTVTILGAGSTTITASQAGDSNYALASAQQTLLVGKAPLTVTADNQSRPYGAPNPLLTYVYDGFVNGEDSTVLTGAPALSTVADATSPVGSYPISVAQGTLQGDNYDFTFVAGTLAVGLTSQTIAFAPPPGKTYGAPDFDLTASGGGSGNPIVFTSSNPAVASVDGITVTLVGAGTTTITASQAGNENYAPATAQRLLTVDRAPLTVTAQAASRVYGAANPPFTPVYSGFVYGESAAVLAGTPSLSTAATLTSPVGDYPIVAGSGNLFATNYSFSFTDGTLTIGKAEQTIGNFAPPATATYGDGPLTLSATATSGLAVAFDVTSGPGSLSGDQLTITGAGTIYLRAFQAGDGNYLAAPDVTASIEVGKATATVTLGALSQIYDGSGKTATVTTNPAGLTVNLTYNGSATAPTNAGSYAVVATVVDDNYQGTASGTLTIAKSAATVTLGNLSHPYDGTPKAATASTSPAGLNVTFSYDGTAVLPVNVGSYNVVATVVATNYQGSASGILEILDTIVPALTISTLADGTTTNAALLNVAGSASDAESGLAGLTVNGSATAVGANGSFSAAVVLTPGANTLTVVATDNAGNESSETRIIHLDRTTPGVTVTLPDNSATGTDMLELGGTLDDPQGVVTVSVNGGAPLPAHRSGNAFSLVLTLPPGVNTIEIVVTDAAGNRTVVKRTVTVDLTAPDLAITEPAADTTIRALPLTLRGSVADALSEVTLHLTVNGAAVTPTVADSTFNYELSATEGGSFRIEAIATDLLGNSATVVRNLLYDPYGDADGNGLVEVADALIVLKMALGQEEPDLHFDVAPLVDGVPHPDGKINVADALVILRRALGLVNW